MAEMRINTVLLPYIIGEKTPEKLITAACHIHRQTIFDIRARKEMFCIIAKWRICLNK